MHILFNVDPPRCHHARRGVFDPPGRVRQFWCSDVSLRYDVKSPPTSRMVFTVSPAFPCLLILCIFYPDSLCFAMIAPQGIKTLENQKIDGRLKTLENQKIWINSASKSTHWNEVKPLTLTNFATLPTVSSEALTGKGQAPDINKLCHTSNCFLRSPGLLNSILNGNWQKRPGTTKPKKRTPKTNSENPTLVIFVLKRNYIFVAGKLENR